MGGAVFPFRRIPEDSTRFAKGHIGMWKENGGMEGQQRRRTRHSTHISHISHISHILEFLGFKKKKNLQKGRKIEV